ncbi:MAG: hypothetical protein JW969_11605, partial [Spirochaetales bacterium]|nr:hypothetical protein [Spirochaetales bacterium]
MAKRLRIIFLNLGIMLALFIISQYNYLLFHSVAEIFSIAVAWAIFMLVWNSRSIIENRMLIFIGISLVFISLLDLTHTLAYKGMNIFIGYDSNLPTQLWIAARSTESITFLLAALLIKRNIRIGIILGSYSLVTILFFVSIFTRVFPDCYVEGSGLTMFKMVSEYIIMAVIVFSIVLFFRQKALFAKEVFGLLIAALCVKIFSEFFFTLYFDVYGIFNLLGHALKITSFYLLYLAIIETGVLSPFKLLFKELKDKEVKLENEKNELSNAMNKIKRLHGLLPICANCKKIRDDKGYWNQIEFYLQEHSEADFSHSLCPECAAKLYPEYVEPED